MTVEHFIGVELTSARRPHTLAILNRHLKPIHLEHLSLEAILERVISYEQTACAINSPAYQEANLLQNPTYRERIGLPANRRSYAKFRVAEYEMRRRGIRVRGTVGPREKAKSWMKAGWVLYKRLYDAGFTWKDTPRRLLETHAQAAFTVMLKRIPYSAHSLEGLLQRQLILYEEGVEVPDPMAAIQEITRHRLLTGQMAFDNLYGLRELNALVAAYTAYIVTHEPQNATSLGDPNEGFIHLPTGELAEQYS